MKRSKQEIAQIHARSDFLRDLLGEFGARLSGFDPGVTALLPGKRGNGCFGEALSFDPIEWGWLEPLLVELREGRKRR